MSPQTLQHLMTLFKEDLLLYARKPGPGLSLDMVNILCSLGADGTIPGNMHRDLVNRLPGNCMPQLHSFDAPLHHSIAGQYENSSEMILPHELFSALYHFYPASFFKYVVPGKEILQSFWDSVKGGIL